MSKTNNKDRISNMKLIKNIYYSHQLKTKHNTIKIKCKNEAICKKS